MASVKSNPSIHSVNEKDSLAVSPHCAKHGPSQTPHLDAQLRQPKTKELLQSIGTGWLFDADQQQQQQQQKCTQCAAEGIAITLANYAKSMHQAKKSGEISKEERKALKKEVKFLGKMMKREAKMIWKDQAN